MGWFAIIGMLFIYTIVSLVLIFFILIQSGKGGGLSSLGSASQGLADSLGATSAEKTLNKITSMCAIIFMVLAISLSIAGPKVLKSNPGKIFDDKPMNQAAKTMPTAPVQGQPDVPGRVAKKPGAMTRQPVPIAPTATKPAATVAPMAEKPAAGQPAKP